MDNKFQCNIAKGRESKQSYHSDLKRLIELATVQVGTLVSSEYDNISSIPE